MVTRLAERHGDEQPGSRAQHAPQLAQSVGPRRRTFVRHEPVSAVVGADVLEGRDEECLVDARIGQRQVADVGLDTLHPVDVAAGEVDADDVDTRPQERDEVRRLGERVPHLEHAAGRHEPGEHPRDLDHPLVGPRRRLEPRERLAPRACREPERDRVVELPDTGRLRRGGQLVEERGARERPFGELSESPLARRVVRGPSQHVAERPLDEVGVGRLVRVEPGPDQWIHGGQPITRSGREIAAASSRARESRAEPTPGCELGPPVPEAPNRVREDEREDHESDHDLDPVAARLVARGEQRAGVAQQARLGRQLRAVQGGEHAERLVVDNRLVVRVHEALRGAHLDLAADRPLDVLVDQEPVDVPTRDGPLGRHAPDERGVDVVEPLVEGNVRAGERKRARCEDQRSEKPGDDDPKQIRPRGGRRRPDRRPSR